MTEFVDGITGGFALFAVPTVILTIVIGVLWGAFAGAMPGFNQTLAVGIALPVTFSFGPIEAVAFLCAISVGVSYGNSIPAILVGIPGTASAVLTAIDGHALHKAGKSGLALGVAYFAALSGQFVSTLFFVAMVVPLSGLAYVFLAPELFALTVVGMTAILSLTGKNVLKGLVATGIGVLFTMVGPDPIGTVPRFTFGMTEMRSGLQIVPVTLGLVALSEIIRAARQAHDWQSVNAGFDARFPSIRSLARTVRPVLGGTIVGTLIGCIPGMGGTPAAAVSYQQAKIFSRHPEEYGHGSIEGVAANEAAQNAAQSGEMVPTLGLGLPGSDSMVLLLAALTIHGLVPGPLLIQESPEMLHAAVAGLIGATLLLVAIGWRISSVLLAVVTIDRRLVLTFATGLIVIGVYSLRQSIFDLILLLVCGIVGYFMSRYGYSTAAAAIAVVLGGLAEAYLRQGLNLARNDWGNFLSRPITAGILIFAALLLAYGIWVTVREGRTAKAAVADVAQIDIEPPHR
jgi:putative tricarboxylic transport membrane protein